jgi:hypothetical protein
MGYRPELNEYKLLERGLELQTKEIVLGLCREGWKTNEATISRMRTGSDVNIDVAGIPFYAIQQLFSTTSGVAVLAQTGIWLNRRALFEEKTGEDLDDILDDIEERIKKAKLRYAQLKTPTDEDVRAEHALDLASIEEAEGQLAATRNQHLAALGHFIQAYRYLLPVARAPGCNVSVIIALGRTLGAALNEAYDCDEADGRPVRQGSVALDWHLWQVLQYYKAPSPLPLLIEAVRRTGDDRMAANHVDGFQLAGEPRQAARMIQLGLAEAGKDVTLETWQPHGRCAPVVSEEYMVEAVLEYRRLCQQETGKRAKASTTTASIIKSMVAAIIGAAAITAVVLATDVNKAEARPGRLTAVQVPLNIG